MRFLRSAEFVGPVVSDRKLALVFSQRDNIGSVSLRTFHVWTPWLLRPSDNLFLLGLRSALPAWRLCATARTVQLPGNDARLDAFFARNRTHGLASGDLAKPALHVFGTVNFFAHYRSHD